MGRVTITSSLSCPRAKAAPVYNFKASPVYNFTVRDFDQPFILDDIMLLVHYVDYIILLELREHEIVAI